MKTGAQHSEGGFIAYNSVIGAVSGGLGAMINKKKGENYSKTFIRGFLTGAAGGAIMYAGKKINYQLTLEHELGYAWLSRFVFSAGNSMVENAAANRQFWEQWHYDVGFVRLELHAAGWKLHPRFMVSTFCGFLFRAMNGRPDLVTSLRSGTVTYKTGRIRYAPGLVGSTSGNGMLLSDSLPMNSFFYELYAHEMIHVFQFQEFSGVNNFFLPFSKRLKERNRTFETLYPL